MLLLVGIGLWRGRRIAFIASVILAALVVVPLPVPSSAQIPLYVVEGSVAIIVLVLLVRDRDWFFRRGLGKALESAEPPFVGDD